MDSRVLSKGEGPTPARRTSWRPGAEGALVLWERWEKEVEWLSEGTKRRDWTNGLVVGLFGEEDGGSLGIGSLPS